MVAVAALPVIILAGAITQYPRMNKHDSWFIMDYADNTLKSLDKNALYIACGDSTYNAICYAQAVDGKRPDVIVLHRSAVSAWATGMNEWTGRCYYESVSKRSPTLHAFRLKAMRYNRKDILGEKLMADIVTEAMKERPVYMGCIGNQYEVHPMVKRLESRCALIPEGIVYRILPTATPIDETRLVDYNERLWKTYRLRRIYDGSIIGGMLEREVPDRYAAFHTALADMEIKAHKYDLAQRNFTHALAIDNSIVHAHDGLGVAYACQGNYKEAAGEWEEVLKHQPSDTTALRGLEMVKNMTDKAR
jgi:tetratricopeptide (TPR) repeat protein